jgi:PAS domain S-box-containing protein
MNIALRCLLVEDSENDARLLLRHLRDGGYDVTSERVETPEAMRAALDRHPWDIVFADYRMPQFSGLAALELFRGSGFDLPFIIVSGAIGDEQAVAAMKAGASDYLLKDRLARLGTAVAQALEQTRRRRESQRAEAALSASERRFRSTLENMMEGCQIVGRDLRYLYVNQVAARQGRRSVAEVTGRLVTEVFPGIEQMPFFAVWRKCLEDGKAREIETDFRHEDGSMAEWQLMIQPVPEGLFILSLDITARKQAERKIAAQLAELLRWQEVMLEREDRVQALKAEVNAALAQAKLPPRYSLPTKP